MPLPASHLTNGFNQTFRSFPSFSSGIQIPEYLTALPADCQILIQLSFTLYDREIRAGDQLPDYAHVVLPIAKGYEGFLKHYLKSLGLVNENIVMSRRFRIGRALNPDVSYNQRDEWWLYDDLERLCSKETAKEIWESWLICRNQIVHYYPGQFKPLTLANAGEHVARLSHAMQIALACQRSARMKGKIGRHLQNNYVRYR